MIDFETAVSEVLRQTYALETRTIRLADSCGYVLAENVIAREPIPLFDSTSVDGYAVHSDDIISAVSSSSVNLAVQSTVQAGDSRVLHLKRNHAIKIFTGAPMPLDADAVVMKEFVSEENGKVSFHEPAHPGENVRKRGAEFSEGAVVFSAGTLITPPVIGMLSVLGYLSVDVYRKPKVAIVITGNELRAPGSRLKRGKIRDANSLTLVNVLRMLAIVPVFVVPVRDAKKAVLSVMKKALKKADVIISTGGVSVGEYDFVRDVMAELHVQTIFWRVSLKPGKPNYFGTKGRKLIFGLPGNPVAALVSFELLVRPALLKLQGLKVENQISFRARLTRDLRKKAGRMEFVRALFTKNSGSELLVAPTAGQDSHMMSGLAKANCLILFPKDAEFLPKGTIVEIRILPWQQW
ncbi:MAG: molybdopterin molybdotransferase MoeA [Bacteroidota bacterium]|nr:molybdopterin molybdotransferase MoeA [Bacteroidota bacterium]